MSSFHRIQEYIKYRSKALSRHGVHSPFVYDFVDEVLRKHDRTGFRDTLSHYFSHHRFVWNAWQLNDDVTEETIIVLEGIHEDKRNTMKWDTLVRDERVRLSLDLFDYGLLFFKNEFLEKQHFVLKMLG